MCTLNIGLMKCGRIQWQEVEETRKYFNIVLIHQQEILYLRALQGHSGHNLIDPELQDNVLIPNHFFEYIYHMFARRDRVTVCDRATTPPPHHQTTPSRQQDKQQQRNQSEERRPSFLLGRDQSEIRSLA